ncbi:MAG: helix-turn-helix domain-containing protein [Thermoguttaceae bacterium]
MPILDKEYFRYLPVSERDKDWGIFLTGLGHSLVPPHSNYPRSVHPDSYHFHWETGRVLHEFQSLYIVEGEGQFESKSAGERKIGPGSVILLFPGEWHRYRPLGEVGWEEFWLSYAGRQIDDLRARDFFGPAEPVLDTGMDDSILRPFLAAIDRSQTEPIGFHQLMAVNVMEVLAATISAVRSRRTGRRAENVVRQARMLLEQHAQKLLKMEQMAASFSMSEKHFRRIFKQQTGLSPYQYHMQVRMYRAKEMLRGTTLSVKEIAASLCFETPFHFSNAFKQRTGVSPSQWRSGGSR